MKYLYMNEQERQMQYYQFPKFLLELQLSQNANDNMQTMKSILKIQDYFGRDFHSNGQRVSREEVETSPWRKEN